MRVCACVRVRVCVCAGVRVCVCACVSCVFSCVQLLVRINELGVSVSVSVSVRETCRPPR